MWREQSRNSPNRNRGPVRVPTFDEYNRRENVSTSRRTRRRIGGLFDRAYGDEFRVNPRTLRKGD